MNIKLSNILMATALALTLAATSLPAMAQQQSSSSAVSRGPRVRGGQLTQPGAATPGVSSRMQQHAAANATGSSASDADAADTRWMRVIYRRLDLEKEDRNAALYFPEDVIEGNENLFRIILRLLANNQIPAYEYLDGREIFTDQYRINVPETLDRFYIPYKQAKGFSEKNPVVEIDESDVPATQVLSYDIIERWRFDNRTNTMRTTVEAICPVLHQTDDFGSVRTLPICWVKMDDLRPYLQQQYVFTDDDNNLPRYTYDDFFTLNLYKGKITKTRNLRNRSMAQLYPDPDDLKRAQDSIQNRLDHYADNLWVPSREEIIAAREAAEAAAAAADSVAAAADMAEAKPAPAARTKRASARTSSRSKVKVKREKTKAPKAAASSSATRSVRNRRR